MNYINTAGTDGNKAHPLRTSTYTQTQLVMTMTQGVHKGLTGALHTQSERGGIMYIQPLKTMYIH